MFQTLSIIIGIHKQYIHVHETEFCDVDQYPYS